MKIELQGMTELIASMGSLRTEIAGPAMTKAIRTGGRVIRDEMRLKAPILDKKTAGSNSLNPGDLKAGIRSYAPRNANPPEVLIGPSSKVAYVARWVEYGHRVVTGGYSKVLADGRVRGPGKVSSTFVPAYPFLRPAFEASISTAEEAIAASIRASIAEKVS